jgi:hypothetical protein
MRVTLAFDTESPAEVRRAYDLVEHLLKTGSLPPPLPPPPSISDFHSPDVTPLLQKVFQMKVGAFIKLAYKHFQDKKFTLRMLASESGLPYTKMHSSMASLGRALRYQDLTDAFLKTREEGQRDYFYQIKPYILKHIKETLQDAQPSQVPGN